MAIASRIDTFLAPALTQQSLYDAIKASLANAGFAIFDEFVSGTDKVVVYAITLDASKTYGTSYLRVRLTNTFIVAQQLYSTWVVATHTGTNGSSEITYTAFINSTQVNFTALNGGIEYKFSLISQGTTVIILGFVAPANKPLWWDLNAWNYCFLPTNNTFSLFRTTLLNPYANSEHDSYLNSSRLSTANPQTNRRDLLPGVVFFTQNNQGISGRSSDDWVSLAAAGTTRYDTVQIPNDTKQYLVLNPAAGGLAVRTA